MIKIDPEFKALIPPLSPEEREQLEANILQDGCRDPLVVWDGTLIDGHNRYAICERNGIRYNTKEHSFDTRDEVKVWIIDNQLGRRNLIAFVRTELELKKKEIIAARAKANQIASGGDQAKKAVLSDLTKPVTPIHTREEIAKAAKVSTGTVYKVEKIIEKAPEEVKTQLRMNEISIDKAYGDMRRAEEIAKHGEVKPTTRRAMTKAELDALPTCRGMWFARLAIKDLEQIPETDSEREQAFQLVKEWINEH